MGRNKKPKKPDKEDSSKPRGIRFEIEENAEQLLLEHLAAFKPEPKESEDEPELRVAKRRTLAQLEQRIDLHGLHLDQAIDLVREKIDLWLAQGQPLRVKIITGKGRHSAGGRGILSQEVHRYVLQRYRPDIASIEDSPDSVRLAGLPLRGHFFVVFHARGRSKT